MDRVDRGRHIALVLVHGPAGYGKTSLLLQWCRRQEQEGVRVIWLSLDEGDRQSSQFLERFAAATGETSHYSDIGAGSGPQASGRAFVGMLATRLARDGGRFVIVLDDYHRAQSVETDEILNLLVEKLPVNVRLAIASRTPPPVPLAAFRARGQLCEFKAADLSFSLEEARQLFGDRLGQAALAALH
ncbi:MAG: helix-turn-helix transcriptional regulator, partial [Alphaproteobacteria bacterium]